MATKKVRKKEFNWKDVVNIIMFMMIFSIILAVGSIVILKMATSYESELIKCVCCNNMTCNHTTYYREDKLCKYENNNELVVYSASEETYCFDGVLIS